MLELLAAQLINASLAESSLAAIANAHGDKPTACHHHHQALERLQEANDVYPYERTQKLVAALTADIPKFCPHL